MAKKLADYSEAELRQMMASELQSANASAHDPGMFRIRANLYQQELNRRSAAAKPPPAPKTAAAAITPPPQPVYQPPPYAQTAAAAIAAPPPQPTAVVPPVVDTIVPPPPLVNAAPQVGQQATVETPPPAPSIDDAASRVDAAAKPAPTPLAQQTNALVEQLRKRKIGFAATQLTGDKGVNILGRVGRQASLLG